MLSKTIKALIAAGASNDQLLAVVEVYEKEEAENQEKLREKWRSDKRRLRAMSTNVHESPPMSHGQQWSPQDLSSPLNGSPPSHYKDNTTPSPIISPSLNIDHFDVFWTSYPKKVGKGQAKRAWNAAVKKADPESIVKACQAYPWPNEKDFIPHASTWLNGERWLDEQPKKEITFLSRPVMPQKQPVEPVQSEISPEERERRRKQVDELLKGFL